MKPSKATTSQPLHQVLGVFRGHCLNVPTRHCSKRGDFAEATLLAGVFHDLVAFTRPVLALEHPFEQMFASQCLRAGLLSECLPPLILRSPFAGVPLQGGRN